MSKRAVKKVAKSRESKARERITVTLKPVLAGKLTTFAAAVGKSRSRYLEELIEAAIDDQEVTVKALTDPFVMQHFAQMFSNRELLKHVAKSYGEQLTDHQLELFTSSMKKLTTKGGGDVRKR